MPYEGKHTGYIRVNNKGNKRKNKEENMPRTTAANGVFSKTGKNPEREKGNV